MKKGFVAAVVVVGAFTSGISAAPLMGPKGQFSTVLFNLEYDPSKACRKPYSPFSNDRYAWDMYRDEARRYIDCMKSAASSDMEYAAAVIAEGYKEKVDEFAQEIRDR